MPNDKSYGSPYKMKAGKMGPMQKNFGASLAINKKLDKDNMAGGLTGKPSTGELDGPLAKKKNGVAPTNKTATTRKNNPGKLGGKAKRDSILSDTNNDGNMITRGFAKAKANRKAAKAKRDAKKNNKANAVFNNAKTEQSLKKTNKAKVNKAKPSKVGQFSTKKKLEGELVVNNKINTTKVSPKAKNQAKINAKNKGGGYSNAKSVNAMVVQRTKFNADPKNKGKKYPGQAEINKRLKKNPKKFD